MVYVFFLGFSVSSSKRRLRRTLTPISPTSMILVPPPLSMNDLGKPSHGLSFRVLSLGFRHGPGQWYPLEDPLFRTRSIRCRGTSTMSHLQRASRSRRTEESLGTNSNRLYLTWEKVGISYMYHKVNPKKKN